MPKCTKCGNNIGALEISIVSGKCAKCRGVHPAQQARPSSRPSELDVLTDDTVETTLRILGVLSMIAAGALAIFAMQKDNAVLFAAPAGSAFAGGVVFFALAGILKRLNMVLLKLAKFEAVAAHDSKPASQPLPRPTETVWDIPE